MKHVLKYHNSAWVQLLKIIAAVYEVDGCKGKITGLLLLFTPCFGSTVFFNKVTSQPGRRPLLPAINQFNRSLLLECYFPAHPKTSIRSATSKNPNIRLGGFKTWTWSLLSFRRDLGFPGLDLSYLLAMWRIEIGVCAAV
jgi:hypothetical protein